MDSEIRHRGSTSQMCLHKILSIINTVPPPVAAVAPLFSASVSEESSAEGENKVSGFVQVVDGFCMSKEVSEEDAWGLSSRSGGSTARCFNINHGNGGDRVECREDGDRVSENSHIEIEGAERNMILLIEAAKLIFGEFVDDDDCKLESNKKKDEVAAEIEANERKLRRRWAAAEEFEEAPPSPVVRSKRGRVQVLPGKFRDSVLEPLTRFSRTRSPILLSKRGRR